MDTKKSQKTKLFLLLLLFLVLDENMISKNIEILIILKFHYFLLLLSSIRLNGKFI